MILAKILSFKAVAGRGQWIGLLGWVFIGNYNLGLGSTKLEDCPRKFTNHNVYYGQGDALDLEHDLDLDVPSLNRRVESDP